MLDANNVGARGSLPRGISSSDLSIPRPAANPGQFSIGANSHYYLTLRDGSRVERLKVTGMAGNLLAVMRGVDGTTPLSWPAGTCMLIEWNPAQLCEFVQQCTNIGPSATGLEAGRYCLTGCTCLDVDSLGRITNIDQGTPCSV